MDQDYYNVKRLALVLAVQAEIEGMKSCNDARKINGMTPAYDQAAFDAKAEKLRDLSFVHNEQLKD